MAELKTDFDYKPDESGASAEEDSGQTISWSASEYIEHQRGGSWYLLLIIGTAALSAILYLWTKDYFATGSIIIVGVVLGSVARWKPKQIDYELSSSGLQAGEKFYPLNQFKTFSIVHEGQLSSLVLNPLKRFMPPVSVFFDVNDEEKIMDVIGDHLPMEKGSTDRIDRLSRRLRF
jgi:hypothetical protein